MAVMRATISTEPGGLADLVRGLIMVGWEGTRLTGEVMSLLDQRLRGVVLFARNVADISQLKEVGRTVHARRGGGALIGIDQEGGRVARLREGFLVPPPMRDLGAAADAGLVRDVGRVVGGQLRALGINLNFAPVLDVDTNPRNPVIADRSFGSDPRRVGELGAALALGLQDAGVAACGKHFPGHGDTHQDSHLTLPRLPHGRTRLDRVELPPFRAAIAAGIASLMTAHVVFEALGDDGPATLSPRVVNGLLREELGFGGVVVSDDVQMRALADLAPIEEVAVRAFGAGVDLLLCCHRPALAVAAVDAVVAAVADGRLDEATLRASHRRVEAMAARYAVDANDTETTGSVRVAGRSEADLRSALAALTRSVAPAADPTDYRRRETGPVGCPPGSPTPPAEGPDHD